MTGKREEPSLKLSVAGDGGLNFGDEATLSPEQVRARFERARRRDIDLLIDPADEEKAGVVLHGMGFSPGRLIACPHQRTWSRCGGAEPKSLQLVHREDPWSIDLQCSLNRRYSAGSAVAKLDRAAPARGIGTPRRPSERVSAMNAASAGRSPRPVREPELRLRKLPSKVPQSGLISAVIPAFNRRAMVLELLSALERQSWRPLQVIVVDDGSTDGTHDALNARQDRGGVELIVLRQQSAGPAAARNRGLAEATGEFIYFIDSDDLVLPGGLATMAAALCESAAPYCVAGVRTVGPGCRGGQMAVTFARIDEKGILGSTWSTHAALYRRSAIERAGNFDPTLRRGERHRDGLAHRLDLRPRDSCRRVCRPVQDSGGRPAV